MMQDGLDESKVNPPEDVYKRIKEENNRIDEARAINSDLPFFKDRFIMPVKGIFISGRKNIKLLEVKEF